ncbi:GT4 family glycosyltransferase PelF [Rothia kristinae]|uniref:GT4 family glycosyltransferase PelF n=1 Tax=Rothia kristinae TaxID=37923 RepID=UPI0021A64DDA|nr:GT4 family glycosyltransferase PelF [Rothia kristinae]MCT1357782.1 GT4 family glycosyltransferase PelF [Rothia kristinae]MCT1393457.1 GT4 family glycosyltransferase PelF [Rothia kristinae]MCT1505638.1 GT4 family glycosyltransferase PelF [Rothia kristinae]MCT2038983.1 GT4 family glycosyltransferase PelF [Rothia kristinae]MCT2242850.1 GT4 family glycosyltransferase PelF [Rothia kristinae]
MHTSSEDCEDVDVAIIMESTYPFLKGGVSAVVHDIVTMNPDISYGIIHIAWDSAAPSEDLYGMPENVRWVRLIHLSMEEHAQDFKAAGARAVGMDRGQRRRVSGWFFDGIRTLARRGDPEPLWRLYDAGFNPRTRTMEAWRVLGTQEFMTAVRERLSGLGLSLSETFWLVRDFMSILYALLAETMPRARVYHAHTTGYASLVAAAAARDHDAAFLLTEHNLYVRDTVNTLLGRNMALPVRTGDYRDFEAVTPVQRAWMAWWIEMGRFCYPSTDRITYLYPKALEEARGLDAPVDDPGRVSILPNGTVLSEFNEQYALRLEETQRIAALTPEGAARRTWKLVFIARVVPIKGLADLLDALHLLISRGVEDFTLDVLGPTDHVPEYYELCRQKIEELHLERWVSFRGTVDVRAQLGRYDLLLMPSYNEGQPVVALEAMSAGIPVIGSDVGGMSQLIDDELTHPDGRTWQGCGVLTRPGDAPMLADAVAGVISDPARYARLAASARGRVEGFFQLSDVMARYNDLYRELGGFPSVEQRVLSGELSGQRARRALEIR